jgi:hypothetical protein
MRLARANDSYEPAHARPPVVRKRSYGALVVLVLYAAALGLNEWRIQRHVEAVRERERVARVIDVAPTAAESAGALD